jgi:VCBS repeat-containing protein
MGSGHRLHFSQTGGDTSVSGIRGQVFQSDGTANGGEFLVNTTTNGGQSTPSITDLSNGGFVVTWTDGSVTGGDTSGAAVRGQIFQANGNTTGSEFLVNTTTTNAQNYSSVTGLNNGGFVVTWSDESASGGDTSSGAARGQVFQADGTPIGTEFLINTTTVGIQQGPTVTSLTNGGFVVAWQDFSRTGGDTSGAAVRGQVFQADGTATGSEFLVNTATTNAQYQSSVTGLNNGGFVVTWADQSSTGGDTSSIAVRGQLFKADGTATGSEFLINTTTTNQQLTPSVASLTNGGFVVAWKDESQTGGDTSSSAVRAQVFSINNDPIYTSATATNAAENQTAAIDIQANDGDGGAADANVTYSLTGGADQALFNIDTNSGVVTFKNAPDFEAPGDAGTNNVYDIQVTASDGVNTTAQSLAITVTNVNEAPIFTSATTANAVENQTAAIDVNANDGDGGAADANVTYSLTGGADQALFNIDTNSGVVTFKNAPNFEAPGDNGANNVYDIQVTANDTVNTTVQSIAVTVTNVNEAPSVSSAATANFAENGTGTVYTVTGSDPDAATTFTYAVGGTDANLFNIDANTGALTFKAAPDFEAPGDNGGNNVYDVTVTASDGALTSTSQAVAITVTNVNENPAFTSATTASVAENQTAAIDVNANDGDGGAADAGVTYSLTGGADQALFNIDTNSGVVTFKNAPDFETPGDNGTNNVYDIQVTANDTVNTAAQSIAITVTDVNENTGGGGGTTPPTTTTTTTTTTGTGTGSTTSNTASNTGSTPTTTSLVQNTGGNGNTITATLPGSTSITSEGPSTAQTPIEAGTTLIEGITGRGTTSGTNLVSGAQGFLNKLSSTTTLDVRTIVPTTTSTSLSDPIVITGSTSSTQSEAFVIDMRNLPSGSTLQLDNIEFASIIGSATVNGGAGNNYVTADESSQFISLGVGDDILFAGAGNDTVGSGGGDDDLYGEDGNDYVFGGIGNDTVNGGAGNDHLAGNEGDDVLFGGTGRDYGSFGLVYSSDAAGVSRNGGTIAVEGTDTINDVEILVFSDRKTVITTDSTSDAASFNEAQYLAQNADVAEAVANGTFSSGLQHYQLHGNAEGRTGASTYTVDEAFYLAENSDVAAAVAAGTIASGVQHFLQFGQYEGRDGNAMFDTAYYLAQNTDVAAAISSGAIQSAYQHYVSNGANEGRAASEFFDTTKYLDANTDVAAAGVNALEHYLTNGLYEGRTGYLVDTFII